MIMTPDSKVYEPIEYYVPDPAAVRSGDHRRTTVDLTGCQVRIIGRSDDPSAGLYAGDVYRAGVHIGAIEDDGHGAAYYECADAIDSAFLDMA